MEERKKNSIISDRSAIGFSSLFSLKKFSPLCRILIAIVLMCTVFNSDASAKSNKDLHPDSDLSALQFLGKYIFFDEGISSPPRQGCVSCHDPEYGGTLGIAGVNLQQVGATGADPHTGGGRKPPTNTYATKIPPFNLGFPIRGGNFWDGRSVGFEGDLTGLDTETEVIGPECIDSANLGDDLKNLYRTFLGPTADQALNPFKNGVEQNFDELGVCLHVESAKYAELFEEAWGEPIDCSEDLYQDTGETTLHINYQRIAVALAAYQDSVQINSFSSPLDQALQFEKEVIGEDPPEFDLALFTDDQNEGHDLFYRSCALFCHNSGSIGQNRTDEGELYTSNGYFNIGVPANFEIPDATPDLGLYNHTQDDDDKGKFKTPTMRNVDKRSGLGFPKAYTHNGWFKSLESLVHFYNTRDVLGECPPDITTEEDALKNNCWPPPDVDENVFRGGPFGKPGFGGLGNLGLTPEEEAKIVEYLKTLTDTYSAKAPKPWK
jgi:cytochrome c peroxidase